MSWEAEIVDRLCELKRDGGYSFTAAWKLAEAEHPRRGAIPGEYRSTLFPSEREQERQEAAVFFKRACRRAWHDVVSDQPGQGVALARFTVGLLEALQDSSTPASRSPHRMAAA